MGNPLSGPGLRRAIKYGLAAASTPSTVVPTLSSRSRSRLPLRLPSPSRSPSPSPSPLGATLLIYHRIGDGTPDELDLAAAAFDAQVEELTRHRVVSLDHALDDLDAGNPQAGLVLTFDDGFAGVYDHAWPRLRDAGLPFTIYLATAYVGATMRWPGSTATGEPGRGLTWDQLEELAASPLVTIANHTHTHALPEDLSAEELDRCSALIEQRLGVVPQHFAYTWGRPVVHALPLLAERFRSAATGTLGRNLPGADRLLLDRIPVRASDPLAFFRAKLSGGLGAERAYERIVQTAKQRGIGG